ncbi:MAG: uroporphyrinogen decarboxylase family protein [Clostridiales bacterium]|jgi:uroporphyrinogen-III decarboxylase|nr:uroporphyrinogen-III decarboxylase [Eubacteriales bacterium]MDH7566031.1 uroporphyrinogen decarboxylase family protein [Clostridiales bacterium]
MTPQEMTEIRNRRIMAALNLEKPDRIPIMFSGQMDFKFVDPTMVVADYIRRPKLVDEMLIQAAKLPILEEIDSAPTVGMGGMIESMGSIWFAKMKLPGRELPEDALWQIDEQGPMTEEDYDTIIDKGWSVLKQELFDRIGFNPASMPPPDADYMAEIQKKVAELGKTSISSSAKVIPIPSFEVLSAARKLPQFFKDLRRMPDKVRAALDIMESEDENMVEQAIKDDPPVYVFIGGTRAGCDFISPKVYEKFYHTYFRKIVKVMNDNGSKAWFHNDSNWEGFLKYFKEFPKAGCIFDPDHLTDIFKIKEILGDIMCITGNVPPALTSVGTPDECYKYAKKLCEGIGPSGFIMNSGCSVPPNAKRENVEAVVLATIGK